MRGHGALAIEPIKISRDNVALDLSGAVQIYQNQGENFQVSTAPGPDGIVRRIEVEANDERSSGDWAVFALANTTDQQLDRLIVAPHFRLVNSGLFWPDLGSSRIAAITPSEGFALDRQASPDADVFLVTLNPGAVVTFIAELASPNLPQVYLWDPEPYKDSVNSYTLYRGIVIGIAGLLALFLTILFVVKGTSMFPATAALSWAVLAYISVDFGFLNKIIEISPGNEQIWRAGTEVGLAATFVVFLFAYLNLNRWHGHFSYGAFVWICGLLLIAGVAIIDPAVAAGIARLSFAATAITGIGLIVLLGIRGYDRAIMLIPSWVMVLIWLTGSWMAITGMLDNDVVQPALGGGLILIILLIGFTVMQHAFAGGALHQGLFSDMERQALAVVGSGDIVFDWDVLRDRVVTKPDISLQLGLPPNSLGGPARNLAAGAAFRRPRHVPHHARRRARTSPRPGRPELPAARRRRALPLVLAAGPAGCRIGRRGHPLRRHAGRGDRAEEGRRAASARRGARQSDRPAQPRAVHEPARGDHLGRADPRTRSSRPCSSSTSTASSRSMTGSASRPATRSCSPSPGGCTGCSSRRIRCRALPATSSR